MRVEKKTSRRMKHHTLQIGQRVSHGGFEGKIVGYSRDRVLASLPEESPLRNTGEWYYVEFFTPSLAIKTWKVERTYLIVEYNFRIICEVSKDDIPLSRGGALILARKIEADYPQLYCRVEKINES